MEFLYFGSIILVVIFFSLYLNKKNRTSESVYQFESSEIKNQGEIFEGEPEEINLEKEEASEDDSFSTYKFDIAYYWITQKVFPNKHIDYDRLKEKLLKTFGKLPDILEDNTTYLNKDTELFLKEILDRVEYSHPLIFIVLTKSRKITAVLRNLFLLVGIIFFVKFQIELRQDESSDTYFIYLILTAASFFISSFCKKISEKIFNYMLYNLKPGDYLRLTLSHDEIIEKQVKVNQLSRNETMLNKTTVYESRNKLICEKYLELNAGMETTINSKLCLYLILNYLKTRFSKEAYRDYLLEKEIDALEFISAFNPNSVSAMYDLSMTYFEMGRYENFYECLKKCRTINGYDWTIEALLLSYEFCM